jgi:hypothetical protein
MMKHIAHLAQDPQSHQTWTATTTTPEIFDTLIISLVLVPKNMQDLFLTFLAQQKFKLHGSYEPTSLIKFNS